MTRWTSAEHTSRLRELRSEDTVTRATDPTAEVTVLPLMPSILIMRMARNITAITAIGSWTYGIIKIRTGSESVLYLDMDTTSLTERTMTYKQLGYWDNMRGNTSLGPTLRAANERVFYQRYSEGWNRANEQAKAKSKREWRNLSGEPNFLRAAAD